ncbi:HNH endonuclease [Streptomyces sp. R302]|uniref:HNH endonuclease n=1 Tax=unclassified Streptomyces TaxID=2593676 RepID=UPI00145DEAAD|nr:MULTISPECIES: HNH endonuclease signature motif containing protein [unclassified Streptomyces]NML55388.1 HNH endonuclease [Streptomyces sp. R301]NML80260.1 HNH endonuclease [Streptomyces sp. R302]
MPSQGRRSSPLPKGWESRTRPRILRRDKHICQWPMELGPNGICSEPANQVDHKIPTHLGGPETDDNYWALCEWHHNRKTAHEASAVAHARPPRARPTEPHPGLL